jgi:histone deacetylase 11
MNTALVYSPELDFSLPDFATLGAGSEGAGTSNVHAFDGSRASRAFSVFQETCKGARFQRLYPLMATRDELRLALSEDYIASLEDPTRSGSILAQIIDVPAAATAPPGFMDRILLAPMRLATGGTLVATRWVLAEARTSPAPIAINLGGGYHHGHRDHGEGFCVYNDIAIGAKTAEVEFGRERILCVDLDAHQGNGTATHFANNPKRGLLDLFNRDIWPRDSAALAGTRWPVPLPDGMHGPDYLRILADKLDTVFAEYQPDFVIYNAGTDTLDGDPLGRFHLSLPDILRRDDLVLNAAAKSKAPLIAVPSGGYTDHSHLALAGLLDVATTPRTL